MNHLRHRRLNAWNFILDTSILSLVLLTTQIGGYLVRFDSSGMWDPRCFVERWSRHPILRNAALWHRPKNSDWSVSIPKAIACDLIFRNSLLAIIPQSSTSERRFGRTVYCRLCLLWEALFLFISASPASNLISKRYVDRYASALFEPIMCICEDRSGEDRQWR